MIGPHGAHGLELPPRLDLQPDAGARRRARRRRPPSRSAPRSRSGGMPTTAPTGIVSNPGPVPSASARERPSARSSASETAISKAAASMRSTGELPKSRGTSAPAGRCPPLAPAGRGEAGHAPLGRRLLHLVEGRVDRRALASAAHSPHPSPSSCHHAGTKSSGRTWCTPAAVPMSRAEREVDPDQLDAARASRPWRSHPLTVDRTLYALAFPPGWRNGRRGGLKSRCPKGRAGSSPAPGTLFPLFRGCSGSPRSVQESQEGHTRASSRSQPSSLTSPLRGPSSVQSPWPDDAAGNAWCRGYHDFPIPGSTSIRSGQHAIGLRWSIDRRKSGLPVAVRHNQPDARLRPPSYGTRAARNTTQSVQQTTRRAHQARAAGNVSRGCHGSPRTVQLGIVETLDLRLGFGPHVSASYLPRGTRTRASPGMANPATLSIDRGYCSA